MLASQRYTACLRHFQEKKKRLCLIEFGNYVAFPLLGFPMGICNSTYILQPWSTFHLSYWISSLLPLFLFLPSWCHSLSLFSHFLFGISAASVFHYTPKRLCHVSEVQVCLIPRDDFRNFYPLFPTVLKWPVKSTNRLDSHTMKGLLCCFKYKLTWVEVHVVVVLLIWT